MSAAEARAVMALVALRVRLPFALAWRPLDEVLTLARSGGSVAAPGPGLPPALERAERLLSAARVVPDTCLYRALARWAVLSRAGRRVRFVMGLRKGGTDLTGHAWVEENGAPLGEALDAEYVVTYARPSNEP